MGLIFIKNCGIKKEFIILINSFKVAGTGLEPMTFGL